MDFKSTFLSLTEYTNPWGTESELEHILPKGLKKDKWGNYHIKVGNSKTIFTCHLDNYCKDKVKINHVIEGDIIKTDGTTILGADNKAGVVTLMYLIEQGVSGDYWFFCGEEPILSGGCWGSSQIIKHNPDYLKKFDRAIAFDRKKTGSIITRQMAQNCCSDEFVDALISEFSKSGVQMKKDPTGYYTDTGNMIELISECTNISIGVWNEHHNNEYVDIKYVEEVAKAASMVDWESLPSKRPTVPYVDDSNQTERGVDKKYNKFINRKMDAKLFQKIEKALDDADYVLKSKCDFKSGKEMIFNHWFEEKPIRVVIDGGNITINGTEVNPKRLNRQINSALKSKQIKESKDWLPFYPIDESEYYNYSLHKLDFPERYISEIRKINMDNFLFSEIKLDKSSIHINDPDSDHKSITDCLDIILSKNEFVDIRYTIQSFYTSDDWIICNVINEKLENKGSQAQWVFAWDESEIYKCDGIEGLLKFIEEVDRWLG